MKKLLMILFLTATLLLFVAPQAASAACGAGDSSSKGQALQGLGTTDTNDAGSGCTSANVQSTAQSVTNILSMIIGIVAVVVIIYAGYKYITSGGDSSKVGNAKTTLVYALIGLVIVALAQIIVHFVVNSADSAANPTASSSSSTTTGG